MIELMAQKNSKKALEYFLNDPVERLKPNLFKWNGIYHEVYPYNSTPKRKSKDSFVSFEFNGVKYGVRILSKSLIKKWYPELEVDI